MSFLEEVYAQVTMMHLPVSSNDVYMAMKHSDSLGILSPAAKRDKVRKALSDLRTKRKLLNSHTDSDGILMWSLTDNKPNFKETVAPKAVRNLPEKVPDLPRYPTRNEKMLKQLFIDLGQAFLRAADEL